MANKFKYNGKELNDELGLDWYDFGARNYDASLGRWMNIDPLANNFYEWSPYNHSYNNPIYYIDQDGRAAGGFQDDFYYDQEGNLVDRVETDQADRFFVQNGGEKAVHKEGTAPDGSKIREKTFEPTYDEIDLDGDIGHTARGTFAEAAGQSKESKLAVAEVIINRAEDNTKPSSSNEWTAQFSKVSTPEEVMTQGGQFESLNKPRYTDPLSVTGGDGPGGASRNEISTRAFSDSMGAAIKATNQNTNTADGATYFFSPSIPAPSWTKSLQEVSVQGNSRSDFIFYKFKE